MDFAQQRIHQQDAARLMMYQNPGYQFERRAKKTLILDVIITDPTGGKGVAPPTFNLNLPESLIIDKLSDIYLDSFTTTRFKGNGGQHTSNMGFLLKIDQFNIQSVVATNLSVTPTSEDTTYSNRVNSSIFIPNESTGTSDVTDTVSHKGKKMNYVCSINPSKLTKISGSISDMGVKSATLGGTVRFGTVTDPVFYGNPFDAGDTTGTPARFIAEFVIVARD